MANITCPQCKRFVDDSIKLCPGCKFNIRKYVKETKKKGGTVGGFISFGSIYGREDDKAKGADLDFLKPGSAKKEPEVEAAPAPEPEIMEATIIPEPEPVVPAPVPVAPAAAPEPEPVNAAVSPTPYSGGSVRISGEKGVSSVDPAALFPPSPATPFRPAYKPKVLAAGPVYDPNYHKEHSQAAEAQAAAEARAAEVERLEAESRAAEEALAAETARREAEERAEAEARAAREREEEESRKAAAAAAELAMYGKPETPAVPDYNPAAAAAPAYQPAAAAPAAPAYQPAPAAPAAPAYQPAAAAPVSPFPPAAAAPVSPFPPAAAAPAYQPAAPAQSLYGAPQQPYQQAMSSYHNTTPARQVQPSQPGYQSAYQPPSAAAASEQPAVATISGSSDGLFESASLIQGHSGGALSGATGPTILEKLRAEEEKKKAEASIFDSPSLRAAEKALKNGTAQPAGGLSGEISFENYITPERGSYGQATAYQIQQAAYVAAGASQAPGKVPPYAANPGSGPGGMSSYMPSGPGSPAFGGGSGMPAYAAQPGGLPAYAAQPGGMPAFAPQAAPAYGQPAYAPQPAYAAAPGANPLLSGGSSNPILGGAPSGNPLLGG